jgi:hypothetical protein
MNDSRSPWTTSRGPATDTVALPHYGANEGGITLNATLNHDIVLAEAHSPNWRPWRRY